MPTFTVTVVSNGGPVENIRVALEVKKEFFPNTSLEEITSREGKAIFAAPNYCIVDIRVESKIEYKGIRLGYSGKSVTIPVQQTYKTIERPPNLLLLTVVKFGEKTNEGKLIEAVTIPWFEIIRNFELDPNAIFKIPPDKWEEIIAGAYLRAGFEEVTLTPRSGDYGRDVIAVKKGLGIIRVIDQVKAYKPGHLVNANDVRALFGVLQIEPASKGFLTTTSDFAPGIHTDPFIVPLLPQKLELINGSKLIERLSDLADPH